jgi:hypothetical protein
MAHDRFDQNDFPFTYQFIAMMLGVRRAGVTDTLHILEGRGLIKARRGQINRARSQGLALQARHGAGRRRHQPLPGAIAPQINSAEISSRSTSNCEI